MTACERDAAHGRAVHAVALDTYDTTIELWCDDCVESVVYGLGDTVTAGRYLAHRAVAAGRVMTADDPYADLRPASTTCLASLLERRWPSGSGV